jgi:PhzF family phenazine biosynthesis protein
MRIPYFVVDAFAPAPFTGNPAGVCPLPAWLPDPLLQAIAAENRLSETAFFVRGGDHFALRWFTPTAEVNLCGHATLAAAHVIFNHLGEDSTRLEFRSHSGPLFAERQGSLIALDFPALPPRPVAVDAALVAALGLTPAAALRDEDLLAILPDAESVRRLAPDLAAVAALDCRGLIVSAPGADCDFVSRFFAPAVGVDEDPVTGSAHSVLTPYWAVRLGKARLHARQLSARGGELFCTLLGDRVEIAGLARDYLQGQIQLPATML